MKKIIQCFLVLFYAATAHAQFAGDYAVGNWTIDAQGSGTVDVSGAPNEVVLNGSDSNSGSSKTVKFSITIPTTGLLSFDWSYTTTDGPSFDPARYHLNGVATPITTSGPNSQSGACVTVNVTAGDVFMFSVEATDDQLGNGVLTINNLNGLCADVVIDSDVSCNGLSDGSATASPIGGTAPYTYLWSTGATTATITGLAAGTYDVTITDATSKTGTDSETVAEPAILMGSVAVTDVSCNGLSDGEATASATGGTAPYTYLWNTGDTTASITGVVAGTYGVTITDANGCTAASSDTITQPAALVASIAIDSTVSCNGLSDGGATASTTTGTAPYTYLWSNGATTASITGVTAGTYGVTITDAAGCTATENGTVTEPAVLAASVAIDANVSCNGLSDGGATASTSSGTAPYTYLWSNGATTASITGVTAGTYGVTITDASGCTAIGSGVVTEPSALVESVVIDANVSCNGLFDGGITASATGGTAPYTYSWSNAATTISITGVAAGTYGVVITDANGCISGDTATVSEPASLFLAVVVDSNATCNGFTDGGLSASVSGGTTPYAYQWSNAATTAAVTGVAAGTYGITVTDNNGCIGTNSATVTQPVSLAVTAVLDSNVSCKGFANGGMTASVSGGTTPYAFQWSNSATTASITGVSIGTYSVSITDINGCMASTSSFITEPSNLVITTEVDASVSCYGVADAALSVSASGGTMPYQYLWSNADTSSSATNLSAGAYSITVTDANNCTASGIRKIEEPDSLVAMADVNQHVSCFGMEDGALSASAKGGTLPYAYAWSNGPVTASNGNLPAGNYSLLVMDKYGCMASAVKAVTEPTEIISTFMIAHASCGNTTEGGLATDIVGGVAPYTYQWSNGGTSPNLTGLEAGEYFLSTSDAVGCVLLDTVSILVMDETPPTALARSIVVPLDSNGQVSLTPADIDDGSSDACGIASMSIEPSTLDCSHIGETLVTLTVTDNSGNTSSATAMVSIPAIPTEVLQEGFTLRAEASGATYQWLDCENGNAPIEAATDQQFVPEENGTYAVQISLNGCVDTSACVEVRSVGVENQLFKRQISLYPNPTSGDFTIQLDQSFPEINVTVSTVAGQVVSERTYHHVQEIKENISEAEGFYFVTIYAGGNRTAVYKITHR